MKVSTRKLGKAIDLSQQAASLRLSELEGAGLIDRVHSGRGLAVRLTEGGLSYVEGFLAEASLQFERGKSQLKFTGRVFTGFDEGRYYVSLKGYATSFRRALGFVPFPGTLNLRLTQQAMIVQRRSLEAMSGVEIPGFTDGKRSYGPVKCFKARIGDRYSGAVLVIERTHYDATVLEVIAPVNLRKGLGLKDGDECSLIAQIGQR